MNLFKQAPTIHFCPRIGGCDGDLKVLKSREKNVVTLDIGPFRAKETILQNGNGEVYHSEQLRDLTPTRCTYGYDVLVYVGYALFVHSRGEQQIVEELGKKNVLISLREIGYLGKKFIAYLAIAHHQSRRRLKQAMVSRGGYILHIDGTCEADSPHLFTGIDGIAQIVLDNIKLPSEKAELLIPFLRQIRRQYGDPIALVHDMGKGILSAVEAVFKGIPDFICHSHFLRDIGKDLFEKEYAIIRNRFKKHKIRPLLRQKLKALGKKLMSRRFTRWLTVSTAVVLIQRLWRKRPPPRPMQWFIGHLTLMDTDFLLTAKILHFINGWEYCTTSSRID